MKLIECPKCSSSMEIPEQYLNKSVKCVSCGAEFKAQEKVDAPTKQKKSDRKVGMAFLKVFGALLVLAIIAASSVFAFRSMSKPDPVADFQPVVEKFSSQKLDLPEITGAKAGTISDTQYNIEETTSLISPYIGTLSFNFEYPMSDEEIQAKPGLSDIDFIDTDGKCTVSFAYQDEEWIVKNIDVQVRKRTLREIHRRRSMTQSWSGGGTTDLDLAKLRFQFEGQEAVWGALIEASVTEFLAEKESVK